MIIIVVLIKVSTNEDEYYPPIDQTEKGVFDQTEMGVVDKTKKGVVVEILDIG